VKKAEKKQPVKDDETVKVYYLESREITEVLGRDPDKNPSREPLSRRGFSKEKRGGGETRGRNGERAYAFRVDGSNRSLHA